MPAVSNRSWKSATIAPIAIFHSNRTARKMQTRTRKMIKARTAALVMSLPQDELTAWTVTSSPNRDSSASCTRVWSAGLSSPALSRMERVPPAPTTCGALGTSAPASSATRCASAGSAATARNWNDVPPENSIPRLKLRNTKLPTQTSSRIAETAYHRLRLPMNSKTASPVSSLRNMRSRNISGLLGRNTAAGGAGGHRLRGGGALGGRDPLHRAESGDSVRGEGLAAGEQRDHRMREQVDDHQVQDRRHAQGEGEALHRAGGEDVEDRGGEEGDGVGRQDRPPGPYPGPRHGGPW